MNQRVRTRRFVHRQSTCAFLPDSACEGHPGAPLWMAFFTFYFIYLRKPERNRSQPLATACMIRPGISVKRPATISPYSTSPRIVLRCSSIRPARAASTPRTSCAKT